jgi:hypothetical protein
MDTFKLPYPDLDHSGNESAGSTSAKIEANFKAIVNHINGVTAPQKPAVVDIPMITGNTIVDDTLSCTMGNWTGEPTSYAYQWFGDAEAISGQTENTMVISVLQVGQMISCDVTAMNAVGGTTVKADAVGPVVEGAQRETPVREDEEQSRETLVREDEEQSRDRYGE